jgi:hypothetical protein
MSSRASESVPRVRVSVSPTSSAWSSRYSACCPSSRLLWRNRCDRRGSPEASYSTRSSFSRVCAALSSADVGDERLDIAGAGFVPMGSADSRADAEPGSAGDIGGVGDGVGVSAAVRVSPSFQFVITYAVASAHIARTASNAAAIRFAFMRRASLQARGYASYVGSTPGGVLPQSEADRQAFLVILLPSRPSLSEKRPVRMSPLSSRNSGYRLRPCPRSRHPCSTDTSIGTAPLDLR